MGRRSHSAAFAVLALAAAAGAARAQVLFDPALGTLPAAQGWLYLTRPFIGASATQTLAPPTHVRLDTTPDAGFGDQAGYFGAPHPLAMLLDRNTGFTLRFALRVADEQHAIRDDNGDGLLDRAGFSVIVITHDLLGIELGFWTDRVWAYADDSAGAAQLFTQAEGAAIDAASSRAAYDLIIRGASYALRMNGVEVLCGPLRDYSAFTGTPDVYEFPDFLFFGDNTGSAESLTEIGVIELGPPPPACPGDADGDGAVGLSDVARLIAHWSQPSPPAPACIDLDADGFIGLGDVAAVVSNWGASCP